MHAQPRTCFERIWLTTIVQQPDQDDTVQHDAAVALVLESVAEVAAGDNPTPLRNFTCAGGSRWNKTPLSQVVSGASQSFGYSCIFSKYTDASPGKIDVNTWMEVALQFDLFSTTTEVLVSDLVNLTVTPSLAKLSVKAIVHRVENSPWEWLTPESRLEVRLAVRPTFSHAVLVNTTASSSGPTNSTNATVTWWRLEGTGLQRQQTKVRLVNVVKNDGVGRAGDQWVMANLEGYNSSSASSSSSSSSLVLSFGQFNDSVAYDPDFSVLLDAISSSSYVGLIVGVSVAVPVAIALVVSVAVVAVVVQRQRRMRVMTQHRRRSKLTVGFSASHL